MTKPITIVALGGSMRQRSFTRAALQTALSIAEAQGVETELLDVRMLALPMYQPGFAISDYPAESQAGIHQLLSGCRRASAMIWASPTYHGTISGVVKNAIDFIDFMSDDTPSYLTGWAIGLISVNDSTTFTAMMHCVHELRGWLAPTQVEVSRNDFHEDLSVSNERTQKRLARLVDELVGFARANQ